MSDICTTCGHDAHCESVDGVYWPNNVCETYMGIGLAEIDYYCDCDKCKCPKCENHILAGG